MPDVDDRNLEQPRHHLGPGYASAPPPEELFFDNLTELVAPVLNRVPPAERVDVPRAEGVIDHLNEKALEHPLRALWVAHRYLGEASPADVRLRALLLAAQAFESLGHLKDAEAAALAALRADARSAQAHWCLAVALYRQGHFEDARRHLDTMLDLDDARRFAPGWVLRGQCKVWANPSNPHEGESDFNAASELDPSRWVVPVRITEKAFNKMVAQAAESLADVLAHVRIDPATVRCKLLPPISEVTRGWDPDLRGRYHNPSVTPPLLPGGGLPEVSGATNFTIFQRNVENLCGDVEALRREVEKTLYEEYNAALALGLKAPDGAPEQHAEEAVFHPSPDEP